MLGQQFKIVTDHQTIRHFLDQRITTPNQQKWLSKLLGYNYVVEYKAGAQNIVPDALSRKEEIHMLMGLSQPIFEGIEEIQKASTNDPEASVIFSNIRNNQPHPKNYSIQNGMMYYKHRLFVPQTS